MYAICTETQIAREICVVANDPIARAIATLTQQVRKYAHITAWNFDHWPSDGEIAIRKSAIEAVCDEMDALAQRPDSTFHDFESLRHKLALHGAYPLLSHVSAVADAFLAAGRLDAK
jgi:hypothetical protein